MALAQLFVNSASPARCHVMLEDKVLLTRRAAGSDSGPLQPLYSLVAVRLLTGRVHTRIRSTGLALARAAEANTQDGTRPSHRKLPLPQ